METQTAIEAANYAVLALLGSAVFPRLFPENALYLAVFDKQMYLTANLEILLGDVAIAVIDAHALLGAPVPVPAVHDLLGYPRGQIVALSNAPPFAVPRDVLIVAVWQELFPYLKDDFLESIHIASRTSLDHYHNQSTEENSRGRRHREHFSRSSIFRLTIIGSITYIPFGVAVINSLPHKRLLYILEIEDHLSRIHSSMYP